MFWAINSKTKQRVNSFAIELDGSYILKDEDIWYADPNVIESVDKEKVQDINKIEVKFRKGNDSIINKFGTQYAVSPHWFIPNKEKLGINIQPESKKHRLAKNWIYNRAKKENLIFKYSSINKPERYDNTINLKQLNPDYNKIGIEVTELTNNRKRADIIIPFKERDFLFGTGIVIEIQFSNQFDETTNKRSLDWATKGYSTVWLWEADFKFISELFFELKDTSLKLEPMANVIKTYEERMIHDMRQVSQNLCRLIDEKMIDLDNKVSKLLKPPVIGICPDCESGNLILRSGKYGDFYSCSRYPKCKKIVKPKGI